MYELKKMEKYLGVNLLGPGPRLIKKNYRAAVSQRLRNTGLVSFTPRPHCSKEEPPGVYWIGCLVGPRAGCVL